MKPAIEHIHTFITVVEQQSFTAAATALRLSKSVISKHITALEAALRNQLFKRSTRHLLLTDAGQTYYQQVKNIPEMMSNGHQALLSYSKVPQGVLRVLSPVNLSTSLQKEIIPSFLKSYPQVTLQLRFVRDPEEHLHEKFDIAILWKISDKNYPSINFVAKKLISIPIGLFATPEYLKKHGTPKTPDDLSMHNCLCSGHMIWPFRKGKGPIFFRQVAGNLDTDNDEIVKSSVLCDVGIAYAQRFLFQEELLKGEVVPVLSSYCQSSIDVCAFYQPSEYLPLKVTKYIEAMQEYYKQVEVELMEVS